MKVTNLWNRKIKEYKDLYDDLIFKSTARIFGPKDYSRDSKNLFEPQSSLF